ncbi:MAG: family 10 glycosylhydrolase [Chlamydiae bacterium]|nr:family 10 glycosylhydrolase [Chlamydiota bacterium]MBI3276345.1 family 10 glycosylhydrolase [Chlamydiota bacterium]
MKYQISNIKYQNDKSKVKNFKTQNFPIFIVRTIPLFCLSFLFILPCFAESPKTHLGLWAPCEGDNQTLSSKAKIIEMLDFASKLGTQDIFLQVYRGNRSWYPSKLADDKPFQEIQKKEKFDPIRFAIKNAHAREIRIHAWFNVFWVGKDLNIPVIKKLGKDAITRDQKGRSMVDYPGNHIPPPEGEWYSYGEDGYWLEPGDERVQKYLLGVVQEVLQNYPELDGIHLDYVRYPLTSPFLPGSYYAFHRGIEFGYGKRSVEWFKKETRLNPLSMARTPQNHMRWDQWRRDQITKLVAELHQILKQKYPSIQLSAAVLPWPERAYFSSYQDWSTWVEKGKIDFVVIMNYTLDLHLSWFLSKMALGAGPYGTVWIGLGPYLFERDAVGFEREWLETLNLSPRGIVLFSYEGLLKQKEVVKVISKNKL